MRKRYFLIIFICSLFVFLSLSTGRVKAVAYDSEHYIEFYKNDAVVRICANEDFYLADPYPPEHYKEGDSHYFSSYSIATGERTPCTYYIDGKDYYGKEVSGAFCKHDVDKFFEVISTRGNVIVYKDNTLSETFFQLTRLLPAVVKEKGSMEMVIVQILAILPMILVLVVSFLGLRKALSMLSTLLHQS